MNKVTEWSDEEIEAFLQRTIGEEELPSSPERLVMMAGCAVRIIAQDFRCVIADLRLEIAKAKGGSSE